VKGDCTKHIRSGSIRNAESTAYRTATVVHIAAVFSDTHALTMILEEAEGLRMREHHRQTIMRAASVRDRAAAAVKGGKSTITASPGRSRTAGSAARAGAGTGAGGRPRATRGSGRAAGASASASASASAAGGLGASATDIVNMFNDKEGRAAITIALQNCDVDFLVVLLRHPTTNTDYANNPMEHLEGVQYTVLDWAVSCASDEMNRLLCVRDCVEDARSVQATMMDYAMLNLQGQLNKPDQRFWGVLATMLEHSRQPRRTRARTSITRTATRRGGARPGARPSHRAEEASEEEGGGGAGGGGVPNADAEGALCVLPHETLQSLLRKRRTEGIEASALHVSVKVRGDCLVTVQVCASVFCRGVREQRACAARHARHLSERGCSH
jgi:hypothetical protein